MLFDGTNINFLIAFLAGFISFLAPCVLAIVPVQIAYIGSTSLAVKEAEKSRPFYKRKAFLNSLFFALGLVLVFTALGLGIIGLGKILGPWRESVLRFGGVVLVFLGVYILGVFKSSFLGRDFRLKIDSSVVAWEKPRSFLIGAVFGFAWSPCIGPVLGVILFWTLSMSTFWQGFLMLLAYGLGLAVPFILLSIFIDYLGGYLVKFRKAGHIVNLIFGAIIILIGIMLLTNNFGVLINYSLRIEGVLF